MLNALFEPLLYTFSIFWIYLSPLVTGFLLIIAFSLIWKLFDYWRDRSLHFYPLLHASLTAGIALCVVEYSLMAAGRMPLILAFGIPSVYPNLAAPASTLITIVVFVIKYLLPARQIKRKSIW